VLLCPRISQTNKDSELIIISDGCDLTQKLYEDNYKGESRIKFDRLEKGVYFSGGPRNKGIEMSSGDLICYLDSDDFFGKKHLELIESKFTIENDWGYFDDFFITRRLRSKHNIFLRRTVKITEPMRVGTCSIVHLRDLPVKWEDGYGHDHEFVKKLKIYPHKRMGVGEYYVCHIPIYDKYEDMEYDLDNRDYIIRY